MARASLPKLYHEIHDHLVADGKPDSIAWPIAIAAVAKGCLSGKTTFPNQAKFGAVARARYCAAYAEYKKSHPKGTGFGKNFSGRG